MGYSRKWVISRVVRGHKTGISFFLFFVFYSGQLCVNVLCKIKTKLVISDDGAAEATISCRIS